MAAFYFFGILAVLGIVGHSMTSNFKKCVVVIGIVGSVSNLIHELLVHPWPRRPVDIAFWIPYTLLIGVLVSALIAAAAGIPFLLFRTPRKSS